MKLIIKALSSLLSRLEKRVKNNSALVVKAQATADQAVTELEKVRERADEAFFTANGAEFHAEESALAAKSAAYSKLDRIDPTGLGALSLNRRADTEVGYGSVATGYGCVASGDYSYAHGLDCESTGKYAHTEGRLSKAAGLYAHAENMGCMAQLSACHAEGWYTTAAGSNAHSEGEYTKAMKANTHAEGYYTIANSDQQHVQGAYNIEDTDGKYAHIVGNGNSTARSNAHTLDWDGNAWFAGSVETVAVILSSSGGKRFKVTVNDSGVLSATELTT